MIQIGNSCIACENLIHNKCAAESLVDNGNNVMSIPDMTKERAEKHCYCMSTGHKKQERERKLK